MRRLSALRDAERAVVAIYDALLFLMVVILVSEGMFLYTATVSNGGGDLSDDHYQHLAESGRIMIEGLSLNESHPMPEITYFNGTHIVTRPLDEIIDSSEAKTVQWLLESYMELNWLDSEGGSSHWYNTSSILPVVNDIFSENRLEGSDHAWMFLYKGEIRLFGSNKIDSVDDLPADRWASVSNYTFERTVSSKHFNIEAELRYYIWLE